MFTTLSLSALNFKAKVRVLTPGDGRICWVVGWGVDEQFKVEEASERVLTVQRL